MVDCIDRFGNTSSATLPIALADARERGMLEPGMNVLLAAFGAGFTWGAGVIEWAGHRTDDPRAAPWSPAASRGIGAAIAKALAAEAGRWALGYRSDTEARRGRRRGDHRRRRPGVAVQADITDPEAADSLFEALEDEFGPVLVLVNNAGVRADGLSPQIDDEDWAR